MANALVTGATGFVGGHLVEALRREGHAVTCLVRATSDRSSLMAAGVRFVVGDVLDPASLDAGLEGIDVVFHAAALLRVPWRAGFVEENVAGARNVAEACARRAQPPVLVLVSSLAAAGVAPGGAPRSEEQPPAPVSRYGRAKLAAEEAAAALAGRVPLSIVRPPVVLGEGDAHGLSLFRMASSGRFFAPTRRQARLSVVDARDLADLLLRVALSGERVPPPGEREARPGAGIYFACGDEAPTMCELGGRLGRALGRANVRVWRAPAAVTMVAGGLGEVVARLRDRPGMLNLDKAREATAGSWQASNVKARALGFAPRPLDDTLARAAGWYRARGWL